MENPSLISFLSLPSDVNVVDRARCPCSPLLIQWRNLLCVLNPLCCEEFGLHKPNNCRAQKDPVQKSLVAKLFLEKAPR